MGFTVLEVVATPNPNARKFVLDGIVSGQPLSFFTAAAAKDHPLASKLFDVAGLTNLLLLGDFVTVNKVPGERWDRIVRQVTEILKSS